MIFTAGFNRWQVLDGLGINRLKPPVKTVRKKQVLDSENGQNWSKLWNEFFLIKKFTKYLPIPRNLELSHSFTIRRPKI